MKLIRSHHNPRIKRAAKLRTRRGRQQQQRFVIDGFREIERAIESGIRISEIFVCPQVMSLEQRQRLDSWPLSPDVLVAELTPDVLAKIAFGDRAEGIVATAHYLDNSLERMPVREPTLVVLLESIEKPGNLGAIARTAEAAGCDGLILSGAGTDGFNPNAIRASTGAVFSLPMATATFDEAVMWAHTKRLDLVTCRPDSPRLYTDLDLRTPTCLVFGNEAEGLGDDWDRPEITSIRVPMQGSIDSLNISTTAAIVLFEARRQRDGGAGLEH